MATLSASSSALAMARQLPGEAGWVPGGLSGALAALLGNLVAVRDALLHAAAGACYRFRRCLVQCVGAAGGVWNAARALGGQQAALAAPLGSPRAVGVGSWRAWSGVEVQVERSEPWLCMLANLAAMRGGRVG